MHKPARILSFKEVPVPTFLLDKAEDKKNFQVHVGASVSMFSTDTKAFFGNSWASRNLDLMVSALPLYSMMNDGTMQLYGEVSGSHCQEILHA
jgi:hypothetical protein